MESHRERITCRTIFYSNLFSNLGHCWLDWFDAMTMTLMMKTANKSLRLTAIPLRSIAAGDGHIVSDASRPTQYAD